MADVKSISKSVSLPEHLWETVDNHAESTPDGDRSGYIRRLVTENLRSLGKLPGTPEADALIEARATIDELGAEAAREAFRAARAIRGQEVAS